MAAVVQRFAFNKPYMAAVYQFIQTINHTIDVRVVQTGNGTTNPGVGKVPEHHEPSLTAMNHPVVIIMINHHEPLAIIGN